MTKYDNIRACLMKNTNKYHKILQKYKNSNKLTELINRDIIIITIYKTSWMEGMYEETKEYEC